MHSSVTKIHQDRDFQGFLKVTAKELFAKLQARVEEFLPAAGLPPQKLHQAMRHAVGGGKRLRPQLLLLVAEACGGGRCQAAEVELLLRAACAVELIHAASLVHDDLPSFDNSPLRRGKPTVHVLFGESTAILAGDALIALAFSLLSHAPAHVAPRTVRITQLLADTLGSAGMAGGQSLESEDRESLLRGSPSIATEVWLKVVERYHALKTASLFRMAAESGAIAVDSAHPERWGELGRLLGLAFQLADDLYDAGGQRRKAGKPIGCDEALGRPNAVHASSETAVRRQIHGLLSSARSGLPSSAAEPGALHVWLDELTRTLLQSQGAT